MAINVNSSSIMSTNFSALQEVKESRHGQIDLNKNVKNSKGDPSNLKVDPLGTQITEN